MSTQPTKLTAGDIAHSIRMSIADTHAAAAWGTAPEVAARALTTHYTVLPKTAAKVTRPGPTTLKCGPVIVSDGVDPNLLREMAAANVALADELDERRRTAAQPAPVDALR